MQKPLVSVIVPVFNGAAFLRECLDSALAQSDVALEVVVLDNASTDDTAAIAASYAATDGRLRLFTNAATLPVIQNWNRALTLMSPEARYCRILCADDTLYSGSLGRMVALAESDPEIGLVGSLRQRGQGVECAGLPTDRQVFDGVAIARLYLSREVFAVAPTGGLMRADLVRARQPFLPPDLLHADIAAWLDILDGVKFGFVHEILSFSRVHKNSITATIAERRQTLIREWLTLLRQFGPRYFSTDELRILERQHIARCHRLLLRGMIERRDRQFLDFHLEGLRAAGCAPGPLDYARAALAELRTAITKPEKVFRYWHRSRVH